MVAFGSAALPERRYETTVAVIIVLLVGVRLAVAAFTPLSFDEALYWVWSKYIAGGYYDHPPVNPILIRLGTTLFGNTEFGVRVFGVLLALPAASRYGAPARSCSATRGSARPRRFISI